VCSPLKKIRPTGAFTRAKNNFNTNHNGIFLIKFNFFKHDLQNSKKNCSDPLALFFRSPGPSIRHFNSLLQVRDFNSSCPKYCCNFTACNEKPKQLSINFYLYGHLMLPLFTWVNFKIKIIKIYYLSSFFNFFILTLKIHNFL
jgi:hypothetical protein